MASFTEYIFMFSRGKKKERKTSRAALAVVAVLGVLASAFVLRESLQTVSHTSPLVVPMPSQFAHLTVDFGNGLLRELRGEVVRPMSALDALYSAALVGGLDLDYDPSALGLVVSRIDGVAARRAGVWRLYVNGKPVDANPAAYHINPKDVLWWKYEARS